VVLAAPPPVRSEVDSWGPVPGLDLMRRVKERFDPDALLAPGRFVGGI
jgi:glycolate oxidase FAD binding subunit